jgi:hypothetical protein
MHGRCRKKGYSGGARDDSKLDGGCGRPQVQVCTLAQTRNLTEATRFRVRCQSPLQVSYLEGSGRRIITSAKEVNEYSKLNYSTDTVHYRPALT